MEVNPIHLKMLNEALPVSPLASIPFVLLLLCLALIPVFFKKWWEPSKNKLLIILPLVFIVVFYLFFSFGNEGLQKIEHSFVEYLQFLILLATLYIVSGGIGISVSYKPTPGINSIILLLGGCLASLIGTMGASALLIRPFIKINSSRKRISHSVIFFILIVSNIGGALTPMGDPPLFMGFLKGVPFLWTLNLWKGWLIGVSLILSTYYFVDSYFYKNEQLEAQGDKISIQGYRNIFLLLLVILIAAISPQLTPENSSSLFSNGSPYRETLFLVIILISWKSTSKEIYLSNKFSMNPIKEISILFIGIFFTMIPAFEWLLINGSSLGVNTPVKYFLGTGILSGLLDNTPTYLMFFCVGKCQGVPPELLGQAVSNIGIQQVILKAISLGAVFMGGLTYIGNGPNLMVKDIAEEYGIVMPSFFKFSFIAFLILFPLVVILSVLLHFNIL